jgi:hypothetical protein
MNLTKSLLIVTLASGSLMAQAPADAPAHPVGKKPTAAAAKASAPTTAKPAAVAAKPVAKPAVPVAAAYPAPTATKPVAAKPAVVAAKPTETAKPAVVAKPVVAKPVVAKPAVVAAKPAAAAPKTAAVAAKPAVAPKPPVIAAKPAAAMAKTPVAAQKTAAVEKKATPFAPKKAEQPPQIVHQASVKESQTATRVSAAANMPGKRDPFVSPIVRATSGGTGPICETGKRCLMVDQIQLMGIVKSPNGFIAVVENAAKRSYFLRENDPIFNGSVAKITGDSIMFREQTVDKLGKQSVREVVKKVNAPVV